MTSPKCITFNQLSEVKDKLWRGDLLVVEFDGLVATVTLHLFLSSYENQTVAMMRIDVIFVVIHSNKDPGLYFWKDLSVPWCGFKDV